MQRFAVPVLAVFAAAAAASPAAADLRVDPDHTSAHFTVQHLLITKVSGSVPVTHATIVAGADGIPTSVSATFDLTKISTGNDGRDDDLRSAKWFDAASDPMSFVSQKITPGAGRTFTIDGMLTMHGVTKPLTLNGTFDGMAKDGRGRVHDGYEATGTLDRTQWGVGAGFPSAIVGDAVSLDVEAEAIVESPDAPSPSGQ